MKKNIKIGIIGGMGPFASAHFLQLLLQEISKQNINMPEIILDSVSIKDFISDKTEIKPVLILLKDRINHLNNLNVDLIIMACNTAHILHPQLSKDSRAPFPSLIDLVEKEVNRSNLARVGLLATPTTIKTNLYTNKILPSKKLQSLLEKLIKKAVVSPISINEDEQLILEVQKFIDRSSLEGLILGCTELPLIFPDSKVFKIPVFNCLDVLTSSVINFIKFKNLQ
jgi:aspartate racemase